VHSATFQRYASANYILPIIPIGFLDIFAITFPEIPVLNGTIGLSTFAVILSLLLLAIAFMLWLRFIPRESWPRNALLMFWSLILLWLITTFVAFFHGGYWFWSQTSFTFPLVIVMLILKRPPRQAVIAALDFFSLLIIVISITRLVIDIQSQVIPWSAWIDFSLGNERGFRWVGLVGNPNVGAPLGVFLVLYALVRRGRFRYVLLGTGLPILFITLSRSAIFSLIVAVAVMALYSRRQKFSAMSVGRRWAFLATPLLAIAVTMILILSSDPTLNGRTYYWAYVWQLITSSLPNTLLQGFGETNAAWQSQASEIWYGANEPHSVFLGVTMRYGIFAFITLILILTTALLIARDGARRGRILGLGLWIFVVTLSLVEDQIDWRYFDFVMLMLIFIPLSAAGPGNVEVEPSSAKTESVS